LWGVGLFLIYFLQCPFFLLDAVSSGVASTADIAPAFYLVLLLLLLRLFSSVCQLSQSVFRFRIFKPVNTFLI